MRRIFYVVTGIFIVLIIVAISIPCNGGYKAGYSTLIKFAVADYEKRFVDLIEINGKRTIRLSVNVKYNGIDYYRCNKAGDILDKFNNEITWDTSGDKVVVRAIGEDCAANTNDDLVFSVNRNLTSR